MVILQAGHIQRLATMAGRFGTCLELSCDGGTGCGQEYDAWCDRYSGFCMGMFDAILYYITVAYFETDVYASMYIRQYRFKGQFLLGMCMVYPLELQLVECLKQGRISGAILWCLR